MKKFLLGLFLILGVVAFAGPEDLPSYVNKQKFEENGYQIRVNKVDTFTIVKRKEAENESIVIKYNLDNKENSIKKAFFRRDYEKNNINFIFNTRISIICSTKICWYR